MLFSCIHSSASNGFSQPGITPLVPECRWTKLHQSCLTLCDPMDCSLSIEFSRQEYWSGLPFPLPGYLPNPGIKPAIEPESLVSPALAGRFFTTVPPGKPMLYGRTLLFIHSKCNSLHLLTPSSQFILLPLPLP